MALCSIPSSLKWGCLCDNSQRIGVFGASLLAQMVKSLPAMWETWVQSLGQEDPLEKELATHCSILAWRISWTEEPGRLESMGSQKVNTNERLTHTHRGIIKI